MVSAARRPSTASPRPRGGGAIAIASVGFLITITGCEGFVADPGQPLGTERLNPRDVPVPTNPSECESAPLMVGDAPLRRLSNQEYDNTVRDLLGDTSQPATRFSADESGEGFVANVTQVSELQVEQYVRAAETLATTAVAERLDGWVSCDVNESACAHDFIESFGRRAFRRPLSEPERADFQRLFDESRDQWGGTDAMRLVIQALLSSPPFLYHIEVGSEELPGGLARRLTDYEIASRISYFLWSSMPDDELLALAEGGQLSDPEVRRAQAERLLQSDRAGDAIASFVTQWLAVQEIEDQFKDGDQYPEWSPAVASQMKDELVRFTDEIIRHGPGDLGTLLTSTESFVTPDLAAIYGIEHPTGAGFERVSLPSHRPGLLARLGFLTAHAHALDPSVVLRGKFVRERLLCQVLPPPPNDVNQSEIDDPSRLTNPQCAGCHQLMDPIGAGLDAFGAVGEWDETARTDGEIVDPSGGAETRGVFADIGELASMLAAGSDVGDCVAIQFRQFAERREPTSEDFCTDVALQRAFAESGGNIRQLLIDIVVSDGFTARAIPR